MIEIPTYVYNLLTMDSGMRKAFAYQAGEDEDNEADVNLYYTRAHPDAERPYIIYYEEIEDTDMSWAVINGQVRFDIVDYNDNADRLFKIRDRIVALLERNFYASVEGHAGLRFWKQAEMLLPEEDQNVWRRLLIFGFRDVPKKDVSAVLDR